MTLENISIIGFLKFKWQAINIIIRRFRYYYFFKSFDIILFRHLVCRFKPKSIAIGKRFTALQNTVLEFNNTANIKIGNYCLLSYGVVMAVKGDLVMGDYVMVGEYSSIRDYTHDYSVSTIPMISSEEIISPIKIGNNVWIGRGCIILPGTTIEDGVVIGANSVVKGNLLADSIYAGAPAIFIKKRI